MFDLYDPFHLPVPHCAVAAAFFLSFGCSRNAPSDEEGGNICPARCLSEAACREGGGLPLTPSPDGGISAFDCPSHLPVCCVLPADGTETPGTDTGEDTGDIEPGSDTGDSDTSSDSETYFELPTETETRDTATPTVSESSDSVVSTEAGPSDTGTRTVSDGSSFLPVSIASPADGAGYVIDEPIPFACEAGQPDAGVEPSPAFVWMSDLEGHVGVGASLVSGLTRVGNHTITCTAVDADGRVGQDTVTLEVRDNHLPSVEILIPPAGAVQFAGIPIQFAGQALDAEDGPLSGETLQWFLDGVPVGSGDSLELTLAVGAAEVALVATDSFGSSARATLSVQVIPDQPPVVTIVRPGTAERFPACSDVSLECTATNPGGISVAYTWESNLEGVLGSDASLVWSPEKSGTHTLTCSAVNPGGLEGSASVLVTVDSPTPVIAGPSAGDIFRPAEAVSLTGAACDTEEGALPGAALSWYSNLDGLLGTGDTLSVDTLTSGRHTISLSAGDSGNDLGWTDITIWINEPPEVTIVSPEDGDVFQAADSIPFNGAAVDPEDGALVPRWSDSVSGELFTGNGATLTGLAPGVHVITCRATDDAGETTVTEVSIEVQ